MGNFAKERISELETEVQAITDENIKLTDQIKNLTAERDKAVGDFNALKASSESQIDQLKAEIGKLKDSAESAESGLEDRVKSLVTDALASAGHTPVPANEKSGSGSSASEQTEKPRNGYEAASAIICKLGLARK